MEELMDFDDAQGLAEYLPELYVGLKSQEAKVHIDPLYMGRQPHINLRMRAILVDWLDGVHLKYELRTVTLPPTSSTKQFLDEFRKAKFALDEKCQRKNVRSRPVI